MRAEEFLTEKWTAKYKKSINCSHPKGFSQKAHCAGKRKHTESVEMEMVCESCGMCQTHGNVMEIKKGQKDSNGNTRCWPGKHAEGTKKGKNGGPVRDCKPNESQGVAEGSLNELAPPEDHNWDDGELDDDPVGRAAYRAAMTIKAWRMDRTTAINTLASYPQLTQQLRVLEPDILTNKTELKELLDWAVTQSRGSDESMMDIGNDPMMNPPGGFGEGVAEGSVVNENSDVLAGLTDILKISASRQAPQNPRYFAQQVKDVALQLKDNPATQKWSNYLDGVVRWADVISSGKEQYSSGFADEVHSVLGPATRAYQDALLNKQGVAEDSEEFDLVESMVEYWAEHYGVDSDRIWEDLESVDDEELLSEAEAWQKSFGKNKNGGLNKKGVASYRRSHPGSKLQTAVTTKPSKLKKGSKAAKRRKSFCARMKGMKKHRAGAKTKRDPNSRINKSLRKWNCENVEQLYDVYLALTEKYENSRGYVK
jgi:hypothetical protein